MAAATPVILEEGVWELEAQPPINSEDVDDVDVSGMKRVDVPVAFRFGQRTVPVYIVKAGVGWLLAKDEPAPPEGEG